MDQDKNYEICMKEFNDHTLVPVHVYVYLQRIDVKQNVVVSVQVDSTTSNVK